MMSFASVNPHDPSDVVGEWGPAGPREVEHAAATAADAAAVWREIPAPDRSRALSAAAAAVEARARDLTALTVREVGKPIAEARAEVARGMAILRYYAQLCLLPDGETLPTAGRDGLLMSRRRPVGVTGLITPWNFPVAIPLWKAAPALAYGNAAVLKPASAATAIGVMLAETLAPHLPDGLFQVLPGGAGTATALIGDERVSAVSFTGSGPVGREVTRQVAARGGKVQAEMGGQNPSLVLADANLGAAATTIAYAAMGYAGQKCTATSRVIVANDVYDDFTARLAAAVADLRVTDPADANTLVGPVISEQARNTALAAVGASGGRVLTGGTALEGTGFYLAPTLVELAEPTGPLANEEVFAPVAAVLRAGSPDEAVAIANAVRYGLVASVFTCDLGRALRLTARLQAGMIRVNAPTSGVDFHAPFGGAKDSSFGPREQGLAARDFYTETQTILIMP
jgi:aldehyde dehydrogenase (NAD+)